MKRSPRPLWCLRGPRNDRSEPLGVQAQFVIALLAFALVIVYISSSVPRWNQVLAYARGERKTP